MNQAYVDVLASLRQRLDVLTEEREKLANAIEAMEALVEPESARLQSDLVRATPPAPSQEPDSQHPSTYAEASRIVLSDAGGPMHLGKIIRAAQERGWFIDRDPENRNLYNAWYAALLRRVDLFERVAPSTYELRRENASAPTPAEAEIGAG